MVFEFVLVKFCTGKNIKEEIAFLLNIKVKLLPFTYTCIIKKEKPIKSIYINEK